MAASYQLGDINVEQFGISSSRGFLDLAQSFVSMSIYESIFTPGIICDITVLDTKDLLGTLKLSGDETVNLTISVLGSITASYFFALHKLSDLQMTGGQQRSKQYNLMCVSEEAMYAKTNYVQKSYNMLCSDMIQDIHQNYLKSQKNLNVEATQSPQNIVIPHKNPYEAVNLIRKRAVSQQYKSSSYIFFENRTKELQEFNFVTIESLFAQKITKDFVQSSTINTDFRNRTDNNIISYTIPKQFSSTEKITLGGPRKVITFDFTTQEFLTNILKTDDTKYLGGGINLPDTSLTFQNNYYNSPIPPQSFIPVDISQRATTHIDEAAPNLQAYIAKISQNAMKIKVIGDTVLTAGIMVSCAIPNKTGTTGPSELDPLMSGNFLVSRIHHKVGLFQEKPRYTCIMELLKGGYEEGIY
jgi:hypothetical protein